MTLVNSHKLMVFRGSCIMDDAKDFIAEINTSDLEVISGSNISIIRENTPSPTDPDKITYFRWLNVWDDNLEFELVDGRNNFIYRALVISTPAYVNTPDQFRGKPISQSYVVGVADTGKLSVQHLAKISQVRFL